MERRIRFQAVLADVFDYHRGQTTIWGIVRFALAVVCVGVLANACYGVFAALSGAILWDIRFKGASNPSTAVVSAVVALLLSLAFLGVVALLFYFKYKSGMSKRMSALEPPPKHAGLILMLSPYSMRHNEPTAAASTTFDALRNLIKAASHPTDAHYWHEALLQSNWGPLAIAVEHHTPSLKHCWLLCTEGEKGSWRQYETARDVLRACVPASDIAFHQVAIDDANDLTHTLVAVEGIYRGRTLAPGDIIADFTGGTAAMSAGMILATLDENQDVEYVRQDIPLVELDKQGAIRRVLDSDEVVAQRALVSIGTSPSLIQRYLAQPQG